MSMGFPPDDVQPPLIPHGNERRMTDSPIRTDRTAPTIISVQRRACIAFLRYLLSQGKLSQDPVGAMPLHYLKVYEWGDGPPQVTLVYGVGVIPQHSLAVRPPNKVVGTHPIELVSVKHQDVRRVLDTRTR